MGKHWTHSFAPREPQKSTPQNLDYKFGYQRINSWGSSTEVTLDEIEEKKQSFKLPSNAKEPVFYLESEREDDGNGYDRCVMILQVKYKVELTAEEVIERIHLNSQMEAQYKKLSDIYALQLEDWKEIEKEQKKQAEDRDYQNYLRLKEKFDGK